MKRFVPKYLDPASRLGEILFALLFFVGQKWADYTGSNRLATGSVMVAIGLSPGSSDATFVFAVVHDFFSYINHRSL